MDYSKFFLNISFTDSWEKAREDLSLGVIPSQSSQASLARLLIGSPSDNPVDLLRPIFPGFEKASHAARKRNFPATSLLTLAMTAPKDWILLSAHEVNESNLSLWLEACLSWMNALCGGRILRAALLRDGEVPSLVSVILRPPDRAMVLSSGKVIYSGHPGLFKMVHRDFRLKMASFGDIHDVPPPGRNKKWQDISRFLALSGNPLADWPPPPKASPDILPDTDSSAFGPFVARSFENLYRSGCVPHRERYAVAYALFREGQISLGLARAFVQGQEERLENCKMAADLLREPDYGLILQRMFQAERAQSPDRAIFPQASVLPGGALVCHGPAGWRMPDSGLEGRSGLALVSSLTGYGFEQKALYREIARYFSKEDTARIAAKGHLPGFAQDMARCLEKAPAPPPADESAWPKLLAGLSGRLPGTAGLLLELHRQGLVYSGATGLAVFACAEGRGAFLLCPDGDPLPPVLDPGPHSGPFFLEGQGREAIAVSHPLEALHFKSLYPDRDVMAVGRKCDSQILAPLMDREKICLGGGGRPGVTALARRLKKSLPWLAKKSRWYSSLYIGGGILGL
jgi:hypothetical protein